MMGLAIVRSPSSTMSWLASSAITLLASRGSALQVAPPAFGRQCTGRAGRRRKKCAAAGHQAH